MDSPLRQSLLQTLKNFSILSSSHWQTNTLFCMGKHNRKEMSESSKVLSFAFHESSVFVNDYFSSLLNELTLSSLRLYHCFYYIMTRTPTQSELDSWRQEFMYLNSRGKKAISEDSWFILFTEKKMKSIRKVKIQIHQVSTLKMLAANDFLKIILHTEPPVKPFPTAD